MSELISIHEYVHKTAKIIATVLDMEVLISDNKMRILADSNMDSWGCTEMLSNEAVLSKAMKECRMIMLKDRDSEYEGCRNCEKKHVCDIKSFIAFPIVKNDEPIGGIGIYANKRESQDRLIGKYESFMDFISKMSDMIVNKLEEKQENTELKALHKRLSLMVESIDSPLIGIDESNNIINCNMKFKSMFSLEEKNYETFQELCDILGSNELKTFTVNNHECFQKQMTFYIGGKKTSVFVKFDPIVIDRSYKGALIYFKKTSDLYDEVNKITNNFSHIYFDDIICNSNVMKRLKNDSIKFAQGSSTILIQGESGTGKEVFARAIHGESSFKNGPFVTVNCAAIPDNLLESELFGHEEGSFTGSMKGGKIGKFELANKGTLFLDEVGEMPIHLQPKLLRAIQEKKFQRIGSNKDILVKTRIIAATNRDLEKMIDAGEFREDLYYRLNVIPLIIPPLRERKEDISVLLKYFLNIYNDILDKNIRSFSPETEQFLINYKWPGNVRELQNVVEYAVNIAKDDIIKAEDLPKRLLSGKSGETTVIKPIKEIERFYIDEALRIYGDDLSGKEKAARELGISLSTLYRKLRE